MTYFGELIINGISLGFIYALISLGFVVIFKATEVINFAQGSMLLLGAYVVARLHDNLGFVPAVAVGILVGAVGALIIERLFVSQARYADPTALAILTIGVDIVLSTELTRRIGQSVLSFGDPWGNRTVDIGPFTLPQARIAAMIVSVVLVGAFFARIQILRLGGGDAGHCRGRRGRRAHGDPARPSVDGVLDRGRRSRDRGRCLPWHVPEPWLDQHLEPHGVERFPGGRRRRPRLDRWCGCGRPAHRCRPVAGRRLQRSPLVPRFAVG